MKAMILAAGRGERMRHLTNDLPKPLLKVKGKALIEYRIADLAAAGFTDIVINLFYLGDMIADYLGDGSRYGVNIQYSWEKEKLDVGGGIKHALPLLGRDHFLVTNADIITDFPYQSLCRDFSSLAHLILVPNPLHHPQGDFSLHNEIVVKQVGQNPYTYSGIAVYHPDLFKDFPATCFAFREYIAPALAKQQVSGEVYHGVWMDVGTPERLSLAETVV